MLDLTKPLLTNLSGEWEPCELGKVDGKLYGVYIKTKDKGVIHSWVGKANLKNDRKRFEVTYWLILHDEGDIDFTTQEPFEDEYEMCQIREMKVEWET